MMNQQKIEIMKSIGNIILYLVNLLIYKLKMSKQIIHILDLMNMNL